MTTNFEKVSLTAKLAAYMRSYTDIPYAQEVAEILHVREAFDALLAGTQMTATDLLWYAPIFEVRYKSIASIIRKSGFRQVLELAGGIAMRGLAMARAQSVTYVDTDLAELTADKQALVTELVQRSRQPARGDYRLAEADALDPGQLAAACAGFSVTPGDTAVISEGLFPYLNYAEMTAVVRNVRHLLKLYGGVWVTPDFAFREEVYNVGEQQRTFRAIVAAATDHTMYNNAFTSKQELHAYLRKEGLHATELNQIDEAPELSSMQRLGLPAAYLQQIKPGLRLWVIEPLSG